MKLLSVTFFQNSPETPIWKATKDSEGYAGWVVDHPGDWRTCEEIDEIHDNIINPFDTKKEAVIAWNQAVSA